MRFAADGRVASFTLSMETAKRLGVLPEDNEGLIDHLRAIRGVIIAVALTFAVVIALIADLDRPQEGFLTVKQQALIDLRKSSEIVRSSLSLPRPRLPDTSFPNGWGCGSAPRR